MKPKRIGASYFPSSFGLSLIFGWDGNWYEDYSYKTKVKYLDIRGVFLCWMFWVQIPLKRYGVRGVVE